MFYNAGRLKLRKADIPHYLGVAYMAVRALSERWIGPRTGTYVRWANEAVRCAVIECRRRADVPHARSGSIWTLHGKYHKQARHIDLESHSDRSGLMQAIPDGRREQRIVDLRIDYPDLTAMLRSSDDRLLDMAYGAINGVPREVIAEQHGITVSRLNTIWSRYRLDRQRFALK